MPFNVSHKYAKVKILILGYGDRLKLKPCLLINVDHFVILICLIIM